MTVSTDIASLLHRLASLIADDSDGDFHFQPDANEASSLCEKVRNKIRTHVLTDDEVKVIAILLSGMRNSDSFEVRSLRMQDVLMGLKEKSIVEVNFPTSPSIEDTMQVPLATLRKEFVASINEKSSCSENIQPFSSNREYLLSWFHFVKRLHKFRENERDQHPIHGLVNERSRNRGGIPTETEEKFNEEQRSLIGRSNIDWVRFPIERVVHQLGLDPNERLILLHVLMTELNGERCTIDDLLTLTATDVIDCLGKDRYWKPNSMLRLMDLISIDDSRQTQRMRTLTLATMRTSVKRWLATGEGHVAGITDRDDCEPYKSEYEHIEDWIRFGRMWMRLSRLAGADRRRGDDDDTPDVEGHSIQHPSSHPLLVSMKARIGRKSVASRRKFPLDILTERHQLSEVEQDILVLLLESATVSRDVDLDDLTLLMTLDPTERQSIEQLLTPDSKLVVEGLVQAATRRNGSSELTLPTTVRNYLLGVSDCCAPTLKQLLSGDSLFSVIHPTTTMDDLILTADTFELLRTGLSRYTSNANTLLREWGILPTCGNGSNAREAGSLLILLSGAPGTGKTYAAHCFAGSLGKEIVSTDCSKILSVWVSESEKHVVQLFDTYASLVRRTENFPVLLLNEADQLLGKRSTQSERSVDRMYHQMQNLFLEKMEAFSGILIATTNLIDSIDEAFSRRFDLKIVLPMPDASARFDLWKLHLPPSVPLADDVDLGALADGFEFSGGQISLVVKQAASVAAVRGDMIRMGDLVAACTAEKEGAFDSASTSRKRQVGFNLNQEILFRS